MDQRSGDACAVMEFKKNPNESSSNTKFTTISSSTFDRSLDVRLIALALGYDNKDILITEGQDMI